MVTLVTVTVQEGAKVKALLFTGPSELLQGEVLDLSDPLAGQVEHDGHLFEGPAIGGVEVDEPAAGQVLLVRGGVIYERVTVLVVSTH